LDWKKAGRSLTPRPPKLERCRGIGEEKEAEKKKKAEGDKREISVAILAPKERRKKKGLQRKPAGL